MAKRKTTTSSSRKSTDTTVEPTETSDAVDAPAGAESLPGETPDTIDATAEDVTSDTAKGVVGDDTVATDAPDTVAATTGDDSVVAEDTVADPSSDTPKDDDHLTAEEAEKLIEDAELGDTPAETDDTITTHESDDQVEPTAAPLPVTQEVIKETVVEKKGGFVPMVLGGAVAAALGYGGAAYVSQDIWPFAAPEDTTFETELREAIDTQSGSLVDLSERVGTLEGVEPPIVDLSSIETQVAAIQDTTSSITAQLDDISSRVEALERAPLEQAVSEEAIAAYENALADLQAEVEAQRAEVMQIAEEAMAAEDDAEAQAQLAASRAALAEITTALDTGADYSGAVATLSANGVEVPEPLTANAESGVATQGALIESFPDVARAALSASRSTATESAEGPSRVATFFANQLGARSVAPREGDDPDAVLSRAEAAVRSGDLDTALTEISALPDVAQSAIADWQASAETRLEAKSAADDLVQQLLQE